MKFKTKGRDIVSSKHPTGKGDFSFQEQHGHENAVFVLACNPRQASASVDFNGDDVVSNRDIAEFNVTQPHSTTDSIHGLFELPASFREAFHRPMRPNSSPANHNSYIRPTASSRARTAPAKSTDQNPRHNKDLHPSSGVGATSWMDFNGEDPWNWGSFADSSEAEEGEIRFRIESDRRHHPLKEAVAFTNASITTHDEPDPSPFKRSRARHKEAAKTTKIIASVEEKVDLKIKDLQRQIEKLLRDQRMLIQHSKERGDIGVSANFEKFEELASRTTVSSRLRSASRSRRQSRSSSRSKDGSPGHSIRSASSSRSRSPSPLRTYCNRASIARKVHNAAHVKQIMKREQTPTFQPTLHTYVPPGLPMLKQPETKVASSLVADLLLRRGSSSPSPGLAQQLQQQQVSACTANIAPSTAVPITPAAKTSQQSPASPMPSSRAAARRFRASVAVVQTSKVAVAVSGDRQAPKSSERSLPKPSSKLGPPPAAGSTSVAGARISESGPAVSTVEATSMHAVNGGGVSASLNVIPATAISPRIATVPISALSSSVTIPVDIQQIPVDGDILAALLTSSSLETMENRENLNLVHVCQEQHPRHDSHQILVYQELPIQHENSMTYRTVVEQSPRPIASSPTDEVLFVGSDEQVAAEFQKPDVDMYTKIAQDAPNLQENLASSCRSPAAAVTPASLARVAHTVLDKPGLSNDFSDEELSLVEQLAQSHVSLKQTEEVAPVPAAVQTDFSADLGRGVEVRPISTMTITEVVEGTIGAKIWASQNDHDAADPQVSILLELTTMLSPDSRDDWVRQVVAGVSNTVASPSDTSRPSHADSIDDAQAAVEALKGDGGSGRFAGVFQPDETSIREPVFSALSGEDPHNHPRGLRNEACQDSEQKDQSFTSPGDTVVEAVDLDSVEGRLALLSVARARAKLSIREWATGFELRMGHAPSLGDKQREAKALFVYKRKIEIAMKHVRNQLRLTSVQLNSSVQLLQSTGLTSDEMFGNNPDVIAARKVTKLQLLHSAKQEAARQITEWIAAFERRSLRAPLDTDKLEIRELFELHRKIHFNIELLVSELQYLSKNLFTDDVEDELRPTIATSPVQEALPRSTQESIALATHGTTISDKVPDPEPQSTSSDHKGFPAGHGEDDSIAEAEIFSFSPQPDTEDPEFESDAGFQTGPIQIEEANLHGPEDLDSVEGRLALLSVARARAKLSIREWATGFELRMGHAPSLEDKQREAKALFVHKRKIEIAMLNIHVSDGQPNAKLMS